MLCAPAAADDAVDALARGRADDAVSDRVFDKAAVLVYWGDLAGLEQLYTEPVDAEMLRGASLDMDGQHWAVSVALHNRQPADHANDRAYESLEAAMLQWAERRPDLPAAHIAYADYLLSHGGSIRGETYAREVPAAQMERYKALSGRALKYLRAHRALIESSTFGRMKMLHAMKTFGSEAEAIWNQASDYIRMNPEPRFVYRFLGETFVPRWYGASDGSSLEYVARESVKLSRDQIGMSAYAIIYSSAATLEYGAGLFENSPARWPDMKQGFEDVLAKAPTLEWHNRYAYFACLARDRETLRRQLAILGEERKRFLGSWGSTGARTQDECVRFAEQA